jgi:hypothetical protein
MVICGNNEWSEQSAIYRVCWLTPITRRGKDCRCQGGKAYAVMWYVKASNLALLHRNQDIHICLSGIMEDGAVPSWVLASVRNGCPCHYLSRETSI